MGSAHRAVKRNKLFGGVAGAMQVMSEYERLIVQDAVQDLAGKTASAITASPIFRKLDRVVAEAAAQVPAPAPIVATVAAPTGFKLSEGTDVALVFDQDVSSKNARVGTPVTFALVEDLKVGGVVIAKAGCKAQGEVTLSKKQGQMGMPPGELNVRVNFMMVGNLRVSLRGEMRVIGQQPSMGSTFSMGLASRHLRDGEIKKGTELKANVADDVILPPSI
jgi:hypothetical protein